MTSPVIDNASAHRYEMQVEGQTAFANYRKSGDVVSISHVEVPRVLEGRGLGSKLMKGVLEIIRREKQKVVPLCSFAAAYIDRHPDQQDLLAE